MAKYALHPWSAHNRASLVGIAISTAFAFALFGCDLGTHAMQDGQPHVGPSTACSGACHGEGTGTAPPVDTFGNTDVSIVGVGAHTQHLQQSTWHKQLNCQTCHVVPNAVGDPGHIFDLAADGTTRIPIPWPARMVFHELGVGTNWDHASATCTNSYCHGDNQKQVDETVSPPVPSNVGWGGTITQPVWTTVDGTQSKCGACHGTPPPAPHPQSTQCNSCHPTMNPGDFEAGKISYPEQHIDGQVQVVSSLACDGCHGGSGLSSPPKGAHGQTATTDPAVGAHAQHMTTTSTWHATINCNECHVVYGAITDQGHMDGIDEVYLDPTVIPPGHPSGTGGTMQIAGASWNATAYTCSNTYCHGGGNSPLSGGAINTPLWTKVDGTQSTCGSCHGMPPTNMPNNLGPHPVDTDCGKCHPSMTPGNNTTITYPALHINGTVDVSNDAPCNKCHGNASATPATDTTGGSSTGLRTVGAHQQHMNPNPAWHKQMHCNDCHVVPTSLLSIGHVDHPPPAIIKFSTLAGSTPAWNGTTCTDVYCHGATLSDGGAPAGGTATQPVWTTVNGAQSSCGSCHGLPPPSPHPVGNDCGQCHNTMVMGSPGVWADPTRHIDGNLDVNTNQPCNFCHGSAGTPTSNAAAINAPPQDTLKNTGTAYRGVGAHQTHLNPTNPIASPVPCSSCHTVFATVNSVGHIDHALPATVIFGGLAGASASWNSATCANVYCHGATLTNGSSGGAGGTATTPIWTTVDGSQIQCGSCHGNPPVNVPTDAKSHPAGATDCGQCHGDVVKGSPTTFSDVTKHIDGNLDVSTTSLACNACHGDHTSTPTSNGQSVNAPPFDSTGSGSATTLRGVGAHQKHMTTGSTWHQDVTCANCHVVFATYGSVGHVDHALPATMTFTGLAVGTTWTGSNCSTYCHGSTLANDTGTATNPNWTLVDGTQTTCGSCHGNPPPTTQGHPANATNCGSCHPDVSTTSPTTFTTPAQHINGTIDVTSGANHPAGYYMVNMHGYDVDGSGVSTCSTSGCHGTTQQGGTTGGPGCSAASYGGNACHSVGTGYSWTTQCTFCHGDNTNPAGNGSPGVPAGVGQGVEGATAATDVTVGAHAVHVNADAAMHNAYACTTCHPTQYTSALDAGHLGTGGVVQAKVSFTTLNPSSTYSTTAYTCTNNYCHSLGGGQVSSTGTSPAWNSTTALACVSGCHGGKGAYTTMSKKHSKSEHQVACSECHYDVVNSSGAIINLALHINGAQDVHVVTSGSPSVTWSTTKGCTGFGTDCHKSDNKGSW